MCGIQREADFILFDLLNIIKSDGVTLHQHGLYLDQFEVIYNLLNNLILSFTYYNILTLTRIPDRVHLITDIEFPEKRLKAPEKHSRSWPGSQSRYIAKLRCASK